jgi:hypothetical protein
MVRVEEAGVLFGGSVTRDLCPSAPLPGKHVLCEKPFTMNEAEAEEVVNFAREKKLFVMEAMWTRHFPIMHRVRALIKEGRIGRVTSLQASFGFKVCRITRCIPFGSLPSPLPRRGFCVPDPEPSQHGKLLRSL